MSDELERLRADLEVIGRYVGDHIDIREAEKAVKLKIAEIEKADADPWRDAKTMIEGWRKDILSGRHISPAGQNAVHFYDHLTAENDRLEKLVKELEAENAPIDPDGYQLGDFRVMKTAQEIARYAMDRNIDHPVIVKTARRAIWAIKEFVEQARHWHGLSKLKPYRWTSLGCDDTKFIDEDFDATESPCDYDPDAHKPLADMQPPRRKHDQI